MNSKKKKKSLSSKQQGVSKTGPERSDGQNHKESMAKAKNWK